MIFGKETIAEGNFFFSFFPDDKFFHQNLIEIIGTLSATGWPDLPCDSSSELDAGDILVVLSAFFPVLSSVVALLVQQHT